VSKIEGPNICGEEKGARATFSGTLLSDLLLARVLVKLVYVLSATKNIQETLIHGMIIYIYMVLIFIMVMDL
jgi:hypothetical protein